MRYFERIPKKCLMIIGECDELEYFNLEEKHWTTSSYVLIEEVVEKAYNGEFSIRETWKINGKETKFIKEGFQHFDHEGTWGRWERKIVPI